MLWEPRVNQVFKVLENNEKQFCPWEFSLGQGSVCICASITTLTHTQVNAVSTQREASSVADHLKGKPTSPSLDWFFLVSIEMPDILRSHNRELNSARSGELFCTLFCLPRSTASPPFWGWYKAQAQTSELWGPYFLSGWIVITDLNALFLELL